MANTVTKKIQAYLGEHGKMSGRDIVAETGVDEIDIDLACQAGEIERAEPCPGGVGAWYCLAEEV